MERTFKVIKRVDKSVQDWMDDSEAIEEGAIVYEYKGCTYGCIGSGIAVSRERGQTPFIEVPTDCLEQVT